jgi:hypothetical protein
LGKQNFSKPFARARRYFSLPLQSEEISLVNTNLFRRAMNIPEKKWQVANSVCWRGAT